jgi:hypothetical protein
VWDRVVSDDLGVVRVPCIVEGGSAFDAKGDGSSDHLMNE